MKDLDCVYTTRNSKEEKPITFDSMLEAVKKIKPLPKQRIEVSRKHYKFLKKALKEAMPKDNLLFDNIGSLYGITVIIKPYLKKVKIYSENKEY